jgi:hypothetical protein
MHAFLPLWRCVTNRRSTANSHAAPLPLTTTAAKCATPKNHDLRNSSTLLEMLIAPVDKIRRRYTGCMDHIGGQLQKIDQNIKINSADPIALHGFTQVPNFILKNPDLSIGAKTTYSLFLSYAWHNNLCFPGQATLAQAIGMSVASVNAFIKELEAASLIEITRRGQGKTNLYTINFVVKRVNRAPNKAPKS